MSIAVITGNLLLSPASAQGQGGVPLWTNFYEGTAHGNDGAQAIAVDKSGNMFVTGGSLNINTNTDYATIKYSGLGVALLTNYYNGPGNGNDEAHAIAVDGSGSVFVTGGSYNDTDLDYATIAYSISGVPLWTNRYDGPGSGEDNPIAIAIDNNGNVFVTGSSWNGTDTDIVTIKYSNAGVPLWTNSYNGPANLDDDATGLAVDSNGNVFVTGSSYNNDFPPQDSDYVTIKYSGSGDLLWVNRHREPANSQNNALAIAVDTTGSVIVTGSSAISSTNNDYATIKYSNDGLPLWTNRYDGPAHSYDMPTAIAVDRNNNVFVTGRSYSPNADFLTIKYSEVGVPLWTNRYHGPERSDDHAWAIAVDGAGNVIVCGQSGVDWASLAYSNAGVPLWTNRYNRANSQAEPSAIAVDKAGNVFVTGAILLNGTNSDYVTIKYSSSVRPPRLDFQKLNNQLVLSWTNAAFNLQSAPAVTGTFTNIPGATSPYTNAFSAPGQFFRLAQ